jgi:hypothetical protein
VLQDHLPDEHGERQRDGIGSLADQFPLSRRERNPQRHALVGIGEGRATDGFLWTLFHSLRYSPVAIKIPLFGS